MQDFPVFASKAGFGPLEWQEALSVWHAYPLTLSAGSRLVQQGDAVRNIYVVLAGAVEVHVDDYWGNRSVLAVVEAGHIFGAAYAFGNVAAYPIAAEALSDSRVLMVPLDAYRASASTHPVLYAKAQQAFLQALALRSVAMLHSVEQVKQRTLRQKILAYLSYQSAVQGSTHVTVPLTRQGLADYLAVDRSALCRELSRLQAEGLLAYHKNEFRLYLPQEP